MASQPDRDLDKKTIWIPRVVGESPEAQNWSGGRGGGGGDDMSDWKRSVEDRLTDLRDDYRSLLKLGIAAVAFLLVGGGWAAWELNAGISDVKSNVANVSGKIDILLGRANDQSQGSNSTGQASGISPGEQRAPGRP